MKLLKQTICKIWDIFNLPRFSQVPKVKIPKRKIPEIVPTDEYKTRMREYLKNIDFKNAKIYINGKEIKQKIIDEYNENEVD